MLQHPPSRAKRSTILAAFSSRWLKILLSCKIFQNFRSRLRRSPNKPLNFSLRRRKFTKKSQFLPAAHPKNYQLFQTWSKTDIFLIFSQIYYIKLFGVLNFFHLSTPPESRLATGLDHNCLLRSGDLKDNGVGRCRFRASHFGRSGLDTWLLATG